jgi:hypothetical protein
VNLLSLFFIDVNVFHLIKFQFIRQREREREKERVRERQREAGRERRKKYILMVLNLVLYVRFKLLL